MNNCYYCINFLGAQLFSQPLYYFTKKSENKATQSDGVVRYRKTIQNVCSAIYKEEKRWEEITNSTKF